jgi:hypothetical protein
MRKKNNVKNSHARSMFALTYNPEQMGSIDASVGRIPHDKALLRAAREKVHVHANEQLTTDPYKTLFVGRLPPDTTQEELRNVFGKYGALECIQRVRNYGTCPSMH